MTNCEIIKTTLEEANITTGAKAVAELKRNGINAKKIRAAGNDVFALIDDTIYQVFVTWKFRPGLGDSLADVAVQEFEPTKYKPEYALPIIKAMGLQNHREERYQ